MRPDPIERLMKRGLILGIALATLAALAYGLAGVPFLSMVWLVMIAGIAIVVHKLGEQAMVAIGVGLLALLAIVAFVADTFFGWPPG